MIHLAIEFATKAHKDQVRKGTKLPYIVHPMETAMILAQAGAGEELICAGLLHDTLEDTNITQKNLLDNFGGRITELVLNRSEDKKKSWEERKQHTVEGAKRLETEGKMLLCADKLSNLRSIASDYEQLGEQLWSRFNRGKDCQKWYYGEVIKALSELKNLDMYQELKRLYQIVFEISG